MARGRPIGAKKDELKEKLSKLEVELSVPVPKFGGIISSPYKKFVIDHMDPIRSSVLCEDENMLRSFINALKSVDYGYTYTKYDNGTFRLWRLAKEDPKSLANKRDELLEKIEKKEKKKKTNILMTGLAKSNFGGAI